MERTARMWSSTRLSRNGDLQGETHVLTAVLVKLHQEVGEIANIVDAAAELALLTKVVDSDEQSLPLACTLRVLEGIIRRCSVSKLLHALWRLMSLIAGSLDQPILLVSPFPFLQMRVE